MCSAAKKENRQPNTTGFSVSKVKQFFEAGDPGLKATEESECELELRDEFHEAPKCLIKSLSQPVQALADRYIPVRSECQLQDLLLNVSLDDSGAKAAEAGQQSSMKPSEFKSLLVN